MKREYWLASDCPNCGEKDEVGAWKGARMHDSKWGHGYSCCSDKCGVEFSRSAKLKTLESARIKEQIAALQHQLKRLV